MNIQLLADHLDDEFESVPSASGSLVRVRRRAHRRRIAGVAASATTTLVVLVVAVSLLIPSLPRIASAEGPDMPTRLLIDGDIEIPVTDNPIADVENHVRTLEVYGGLAAPEAVFDLRSLGEEQPLIQGVPAWGSGVDPGDVPVVYIGDVAGRSVFVHTNGGIGLLDRVLSAVRNEPYGPHICLSIGDGSTTGDGGFCGSPLSIPEHRATSGSLNIDGADGGYVGDFVSWIGLPPNTAVVAFEHEDGLRLWQRPYGDTAVFDLGGPRPGASNLIAFDPEGQVVYELQVRIHERVTNPAFNEDVEIAPPDEG